MGFPTANFNFDEHKLIPKCGVYATKTYIGDKVFRSITNVGSHPTFGFDGINCETHIIGYDGDLYDAVIKVEFYEYLRDIIKFSDKNELADQLKNDIKRTEEVLKL